jgi:restriction endonuclease Mrr
MSIQQRGYKLEKILLELGRLSQLEVTEPFRVIGEQIDGAVKYDGEHYLIEAKWQDQTASNEPVYQFVGKVEGKMYGRGIFVSVHGFSDNVVRSILSGKAIKTVFIDGEDLIYVLEENLSFSQLLDVKVKAAQTRGEIYVHPLTGKSKVP